jgi:hypothetical protein
MSWFIAKGIAAGRHARASSLAAVAACAVGGSGGFFLSVQQHQLSSSCEASDDSAAAKQHLLQYKQGDRKQSSLLRSRMTSVGRFSLVSETPRNPSIPVMVLALSGKPFRPEDFVRLYQQRGIEEKHPRFGAHLDPGRRYFVMPSNISNMPFVQSVLYPLIPKAELKDRINDAIQDPLDLDARLWEARTATGGRIGQSGIIPESRVHDLQQNSRFHHVESLLLFRAHHCMADGVSLGAFFGDLADEGEEFQEQLGQGIAKLKAQRKKVQWWKKLLMFLHYWCFGTLKALLYQCYLFIASWRTDHNNPWDALRKAYSVRNDMKPDEDIVEPRSLAWRQIASVDEVKGVADYYSQQTKSRITINDIFCSCVNAAIVKLLQYQRTVNPWLTKDLELPYMNLVIPVHLHGGVLLPGKSMGNKIGAMVARIPCEEGIAESENPFDMAQNRLIAVNRILTERKKTPAAVLSYMMASIMGYWSSVGSGNRHSSTVGGDDESMPVASSWTSWWFERAHANASVVVTNVRGPDKMIHLEGRPVEASLGFLPLPPGVPIGVVVFSYNQQMSCTIAAEPWAVPDGDQFMTWVKEEYQILKYKADYDNR